jgi:aldose 1-epimerase
VTFRPSGEQHEIVAGSQRAILVEVGGGVRAYEVDGVPVLAGYAEDELCVGGAGQILAPWPNRIEGGRYSFGGEDFQLALTEPSAGNAIHGLTRWQSWRRVDGGADWVELAHDLHPHPGYPFALALSVRWSVGPDGLRAEHAATNTGDRPCPFGLGVHPYVAFPGRRVDELSVSVPAAGGELRFDPVGEEKIDDAYRLGGDTFEVWSDDGAVEVRLGEAFRHGQVFTGDTLPESRRRWSVAVEPMTCPPQAFRTGEDLVVLEPGATWRGDWSLRRA